MLKPLWVGLTLLATLAVTTSLKHIPLSSLVGTSSLVITSGGLFALAIKIGRKDFMDMFLGRSDKQNVKLAVISLAMTAALGMTLGLMVLMNNLQNPDVIGPAMAASTIAVIYSLLLTGYLTIVNTIKPGLENKKNLIKHSSVSVANDVYKKDDNNEKHAA